MSSIGPQWCNTSGCYGTCPNDNFFHCQSCVNGEGPIPDPYPPIVSGTNGIAIGILVDTPENYKIAYQGLCRDYADTVGELEMLREAIRYNNSYDNCSTCQPINNGNCSVHIGRTSLVQMLPENQV